METSKVGVAASAVECSDILDKQHKNHELLNYCAKETIAGSADDGHA